MCPEACIVFMHGPKVENICILEEFTDTSEWAKSEGRTE